jgi:hypothetical protein
MVAGMNVGARASTYAERRTGTVIALQVRLGAMTQQQLSLWFRRMTAYSAAYRDEWDKDVIDAASATWTASPSTGTSASASVT